VGVAQACVCFVRSLVATFVSNAERENSAWHKRLYNFLRKTKIASIAIAVTAEHIFANSSPCRT